MAKSKKPSNINVEALIEKAKTQERANNVWKGEKPGDAIVGTVERMKFVKGEGETPYLLVTLRRPDDELVRHSCGVILQEEFQLQDVKIGEVVAIYYHGKEGRTGIYSLATQRE